MKRDNLILIGFMGSGKTSVGLRLSYKLRRPVEDTDRLIERREGCFVSDIFARKGEEYFRRQETALLEELMGKKHKVIYSVGGGTPVRQENRELLRQLGTVIYLRVRPETVYERLKGDNTRPLLQCENPLERIRELLDDRSGAYEACADIVLDVDEMDMDEIMDAIQEAVWASQGVCLKMGR